MKKLFHFLENKTKVDIRYLVGNGSWLASSQLVSSASSFVLAIVFANRFDAETYGLYKYVLSIFSLLLISTVSGINTALTRAVAQDEHGALIPALKTRIRFGWWGAIISVVVSIIFLSTGKTLTGLCLLAVTPFLPFFDSFSVYDAYLAGKQNFKFSTKLSVYSQIATALTTLGVVFLTKNIVILVFWYAFIWTFIRSLCYRYVIRRYADQELRGTNESPLHYGKHLSFMNILASVSFQLDKILLFHFLGATEVALYSVAIAPVQQGRTGNKILASIIAPRFSKRSPEELRETMNRKLGLLFLASLLACVVYILIAPFVFKYIFPKYIDVIKYSQAYALILLFTPRLLLQQALTALQATRSLYIIQTAVPLTKIAIMGICIPIFGIWGVFIAIFATEILNSLLSWIYFLKNTDRS